MKGIVREDVLTLLDDVLAAIKTKDTQKLTELSDHTVHDASIYQDKYSISIAVVIYSLSKIFQKNRYKGFRGWARFYDKCIDCIGDAKNALSKNDDKGYDESLKNLYKVIGELEHKLGEYITEVLNQAQIKKGGKIYAHGISTGRAAELLGISTWELMSYIGYTKIVDANPLVTKKVKARLEFAEKLFRKKE